MRLARVSSVVAAAGLVALVTPAVAADPPSNCRALLEELDFPSDEAPAIPQAARLPAAAFASPDAFARAVGAVGGKPVLIAGADLRGWDMRAPGRALPNLCFVRSNLAGSRWDDIDLPGSAFVRSELSGARFDFARLPGVLLRDSRLAGTIMRMADLTGGSLDGGWFADLSQITGSEETASSLDGWVLQGADLTDFKFACGIEVYNGCPLERSVVLVKARLTGTDFSAFPGWGGFAVAEAILDRTVIAPDQVRYFAEARQLGPLILAGADERLALGLEETRTLIAGYRAAADDDNTPSFACDRAQAPAERLVCSEEGRDAGLAQRDRQLAAAFAAVRDARPDALAEQREWLVSRNRCETIECIAESYDQRLAVLLGQAGMPAWLQPDKPALFVEASVVPRLGSEQAALLAKVSPVLVAAADQGIVVTRKADGTLDAVGQSIGANAHICTLDVSGLQMDPKTGWFFLFGAGGKATPAIRLIGQRIEVFANGRLDYEAWPDADFVSCGARASFADGVRIEADPALIAGLASGWAE